jgi:hypothetical protein
VIHGRGGLALLSSGICLSRPWLPSLYYALSVFCVSHRLMVVMTLVWSYLLAGWISNNSSFLPRDIRSGPSVTVALFEETITILNYLEFIGPRQMTMASQAGHILSRTPVA